MGVWCASLSIGSKFSLVGLLNVINCLVNEWFGSLITFLDVLPECIHFIVMNADSCLEIFTIVSKSEFGLRWCGDLHLFDDWGFHGSNWSNTFGGCLFSGAWFAGCCATCLGRGLSSNRHELTSNRFTPLL